jgi:hypothetical protein
MKLQCSVSRKSQHGVVLIMTLFTLFIVIALITQLSIGAEVLYQASNNRATELQMNLVGRTSAHELIGLIRDDASGEASQGGFSSALSGGAMSMPEGLDGGMGDDSGFRGGAQGEAGAELDGAEGDEAAGEGEEDANVDSFEDSWARPMRMQLGDFEMTTFVDDENAKYSLVMLAEKDAEKRDEAIERTIRILDALRDDFDDDLSESDARIIVDEIISWMNPDSRSLDWPQPPRLSFDEEEHETLLLNSLEELMLIEGITPALFYDQVRDGDRIAPGIESVFTVYTLPKFTTAGEVSLDEGEDIDEEQVDEALSDDASTGDSEEEVTDNAGNVIDGEGGMKGVLDLASGVGTKINMNTAPRAVVEGLFPTYELPPVKTEALLEWRNEVDEEALAEREDSQDGSQEDLEDIELRESIFGVNEDDPKQFFKTLADLEKVPGFDSEELDPETEGEIQELLGVQSEIFSIYIYVRRSSLEGFEQESYYHEPPGTVLRLKAVIWRAPAEDGTKIVYLRDWHKVPYTRWRIPDFQRDLPSFEAQKYE